MNEQDIIRAADVAERRTADSGFSAGWGAHFLPAEEYVIDCHMHIDGKEPWIVRRGLDLLFDGLAPHRLDQVIVVDGGPGSVDWYGEVTKTDRRFHFMIWMKPDKPDAAFLRRAHKAGCKGLKLHNWQVMNGEFQPDVWEKPEWQEVFAAAQDLGMPVLWHVTQVETAAPYIGEGAGNSLSHRRKKGCTLTNRELLDRFLAVVDRFKGITFVGAHLLYLGNDSLDRLFDAHENLAVDTSCGYFVRFGDRMPDADALAARSFVEKWADRILFATDNKAGPAHSNAVCFEAFRCHLRYIHQLRLSQETLDKVAWLNAKRVFRLNEGDPTMTATTRP
jgi:predicted TIM-barrel fold metal-dependent hydrolase